jgi:protoporphyrinogen oxidase/SAM-dependent methyltransferase
MHEARRGRALGASGDDMINIAIVGGGPGGLMTSWHIDNKIEHEAHVTIFEASDRLGGKIATGRFDKTDALYEAGVAEIYGYWTLGPDPLREMIDGFGLETVPMDSETVVMDGRVMVGVEGVKRVYGAKTANAVKTFRKTCSKMLSPAQYYEGVGKDDNSHPWSNQNCQQILESEVHDETARKFFKIAARSDIASEPHLTTGLNGLKNFLMDLDGYIDLYSIVGGNQQLIDKLIEHNRRDANNKVELGSRVLRCGRGDNGKYYLHVQAGGKTTIREFDMVVFCLPHNWLGTVEFDGEALQKAMVRHIAHFDRPAHYLRVTLAFDRKVWEPHVQQSWWMSDTFGGCCVYIENTRHAYPEGQGALGWLIAGSDALAYCNLSDQELIDAALASLPPVFGDARKHLIEGRVHRWLSSVNAIPGGVPVRSARENHLPEPADHPGVFVTGDYLYDSTLNGLLDSCDIASDLVVTELTRIRYARQLEADSKSGKTPRIQVDKAYFDNYRNLGPYAGAYQTFFDAALVDDLIRAVWKPKKKYRLLVTGAASGLVVRDLRKRGVDAWGLENNIYIHSQTPEDMQQFNVLGSVTDIPFEDDEFDVIYDTALCHVAENRVEWAVEEMHRVAGKGVFFSSVTSDLPSQIIDRWDLLRGVKRLGTYWEWSDIFFDNDFEMAIADEDVLAKLWERVLASGKGPGFWFDDAEALRYSFYTKLEGEEDDD